MVKKELTDRVSTLYVKGMHCAACETLIEKRLKEIEGVKEAVVRLTKETAEIRQQKDKIIRVRVLNDLFKDDGYQFSTTPFSRLNRVNGKESTGIIGAMLTAGLLIIGYLIMAKSGLASAVTVNGQSSLALFLAFGLVAGVSSCAALVGGIILALGKQWQLMYRESDSILEKAQPYFLFNIGRVLGYAGLGAVLGVTGSFFNLSLAGSAIVVIGVSIIMVITGLQMVGVKVAQNFQIRLPGAITGRLADESNFRSQAASLLMGALTFFLPCGFTVTAQALALASGSALQGGLIMGLFALGTVPGLLAIGLGSLKLSGNPLAAKRFSIVAGILVLFFAAININSQLTVLGVLSPKDRVFKAATFDNSVGSNLPPIVNGRQVIKITASSAGYSPNMVSLRANTPTRWEVSDGGFSGCTNAIIGRGLFEGRIDLVRGGVAIKEFVSPEEGTYRFSCWMGMVSGTAEVVNNQ
ncbi:MAG: sulfite exporter TauE/SafE family protein [Candidatus Shapirobacteria bacterium]|jgi:sulfite exporter TauE/SafE/copper chaperone CopZ